MYVLGTAGHVDHGKSTLVHALTGIHPDRWAEEQRREMTIDLGFAWLTLPSGRAVSLIDVPGHERFIKNMLAGVGGVDAALLVIAADEGVMPQTAEHLAILDLLGVSGGVVALTKTDLVEPDWLTLVTDEVRAALTPTTMAAAALVPVSARTGSGLPALLAALDTALDALPARGGANGAPRLSIDRSFTIGGFGTVVTGTLLDGPLTLGGELEALPRGLRARVRGLQSHTQKLEIARPGTRVAVNLSGVSHHDLQRGDTLTLPGALQPTQLLDVQVRLVRDLPQPLRQNDPLDLFVGAAETPCRATILDQEALAAGMSGWLQLRLERPVAVVRGDRYILRRPSPGQTLGGGVILDPHPARHRRFRPEVIAQLAALARGTPADLLRTALAAGAPLTWDDALAASGLNTELLRQAVSELAGMGDLVVLAPGNEKAAGTSPQRNEEMKATKTTAEQAPERASASTSSASASVPPAPERASVSGAPERALASGAPASVASVPPTGTHLISATGWTALSARVTAALSAYHQRQPLRSAMPREELRSRVRLSGAALDAVLAAMPTVTVSPAGARLADFLPRLDQSQQRAVQQFSRTLQQQSYTPPPPDLPPDLLAWFVEHGHGVQVSADVVFHPTAYAELVHWVQQTLETDSSVTVAQLRDRFGTSRKYALALLEHLDATGVTRRVGDARVRA